MSPRVSSGDLSDANAQTAKSQLGLVNENIPSPAPFSSNFMKSISTAVWEREQQEAEELFHQRVEKLSKALWRTPTSLKRRVTPSIEHRRGGDLNHITSITIPWLSGTVDRNLIVRVSRWDQHRLDRQVAILSFVHQKTTIPVPIVSATDFTCNNALQKPFVLQRWVSGSDLQTIWTDLSHSQRCKVASELGGIIRSLLSVERTCAGVVEARLRSIPCNDNFHIVLFEVGDQDEHEETNETGLEARQKPRVLRESQNTLEFFQSQLGRWRAVASEASCGEIDNEVTLWDSMLKAIHEMEALGLFEKMLNCLCHVDLHPGNIMAQVQPDGTIAISGILDWDEAIIAPKFMTCMPLAWLWDDAVFGEHRYDDEGLDPWPYELEGANATPPTLEKQELKSTSDEHAGPEFRRLAYDETYRLCRGFFRIVKEGLNDNQSWKSAERILTEWACLRQSLIASVSGGLG